MHSLMLHQQKYLEMSFSSHGSKYKFDMKHRVFSLYKGHAQKHQSETIL